MVGEKRTECDPESLVKIDVLMLVEINCNQNGTQVGKEVNISSYLKPLQLPLRPSSGQGQDRAGQKEDNVTQKVA